jgi:hypothetical protein
MDKKLGSNNPYEAFFSAPAVKTSQVDHKTTHLFSSLNPEITHSRKSYHRIQSSKYS